MTCHQNQRYIKVSLVHNDRTHLQYNESDEYQHYIVLIQDIYHRFYVLINLVKYSLIYKPDQAASSSNRVT